MKQYRMKEWFFQKVAKEVGAPRVWNNTLFAVFGETEKAYHAIVGSVTFKKTLWIPKSCVEIDEEETSYGTMFGQSWEEAISYTNEVCSAYC